jgi:hypothetical protein
MHKTKQAVIGKIAIVLFAATIAALTGCVGSVDRPRGGTAYVEQPVYVEGSAVRDDYVYYPGYEVYYNRNRRQYIYRDGRTWVSRPAPPRVSVDVLFASPSVRLDFHDHPSNHHPMIARQYPRQWRPPGENHGRGDRN